jgi:hypothetical protein
MSQFSSPRPLRGGAAVVAVLFLLSCAEAFAASGSTLTPDHLTYVVNKDVGNERWTINLNLASLAPPRVMNVTGNVYRSGQSPSFIWCQVRDDSTGTLSDPGSSFRLRCSGASACGETATGCARSQWRTIADPVEIPASFFLPPGGNGVASLHARPETAVAPATSGAASSASAAVPPASAPSSVAAPADNQDRGTNLPPDAANFLVNKQLGGLRWSISLNQIPAQRGNSSVSSCGDALDCIVTNRFLNVTGNVYPLDGSAPQFVYCQERQNSAGDLANPDSEFHFGCVGASACQKTASECADHDWQVIPGGNDIAIPASFFLPPGGLPATPQSDPDIVVIGRTSDPPSVVVPLGQGASASDTATVQACSEGAACTTSIGSCSSVRGRIVLDATVGCACKVDDVPPSCITCGGGATGVCGGDCQYQIGGAVARGQCLPFSSASGDCACYAANTADQVAISICGGSLGSECPAGKCCTDDVRDGCDPAAGDVDCPGICVDANGCDPTVSQCGSCFDQRAQSSLFCGSLEAPAGASCCEDCPDGTNNCYCQPGRVCELESEGGGCCPTTRPDICDQNYCIPSGADCCADCPAGVASCYCATGSLCVLEKDGGGCCPPDLPVGCGGSCFAAGTDCCPDGSSYCDPGTLCTADLLCVPSGPDDCGDGTSCAAGTLCVSGDPHCCAADLTCGGGCLTHGEDCCGDGYYCDPGSVCVGQGAAATCCPADKPVGCGNSCLPPGSVCSSAEGAKPSVRASSTSASRVESHRDVAGEQSLLPGADAVRAAGRRGGVPSHPAQ